MTSGAVVLAVPSAFQAVTGAAHWEALLRARAIEEQSYVLAAAQWGPGGPPDAGHRTFGNAMIVDPWGSIVVRAPDEADGVWFAELDAGEVRAVRRFCPPCRTGGSATRADSGQLVGRVDVHGRRAVDVDFVHPFGVRRHQDPRARVTVEVPCFGVDLTRQERRSRTIGEDQPHDL